MTAETTADERSRESPRRWVASALALLVVASLLVSAPTASAAGTVQSGSDAGAVPTGPAFVVALDEDGSARVTLAVAFDLTTDAERGAFERLRENGTAREARVSQFESQMAAIAANVESETGREMTVRNAGIAFADRNDTGIVALSVRWTGLAARSNDGLVLREPFASGFDPERPFAVVPPEGYELAAGTPDPTVRTAAGPTWRTEDGFDGFEATFVPVSGSEAGGSDATGDVGEVGVGAPGFGVGTAVVALLVTAAVGYRRRTRR